MKKYLTIDTSGQITAICKAKTKNIVTIAREIMLNDAAVEQVAFITPKSIRMMGGELSLNGTLAGLYAISLAYGSMPASVRLDGLNLNVSGVMYPGRISTRFPASIIKHRFGPLVVLQGISYLVLSVQTRSQTVGLWQKAVLQILSLINPAGGIIYSTRGTITPLIYVRKTRSYVWENACGSGSLAYALVSGRTSVKQPSGSVIEFTLNNSYITVTSTVKEL